MKPGIKSTEFWTMVIGTFGSALLAALAEKAWFAVPLAVAGVALPAVYIWGRAILKAEQTRQTDIIPDAWEPTVERLLDLAEALAKALPAATEADGD